MYLRKLTIDVLTTGVASNVDYSTDVSYGTVYAIQYVSSTAGLPTTSVVSFTGSNSGIAILGSLTLSTDGLWYPRGKADDTTGADFWSETTCGVFPTEIPVVGEKITCTIVGCTSEAAVGTFHVYFKGA